MEELVGMMVALNMKIVVSISDISAPDHNLSITTKDYKNDIGI